MHKNLSCKNIFANKFGHVVRLISDLKAMDYQNHMRSLIAITVCKVIPKLLSKVDFWYQINLFSSFVKVINFWITLHTTIAIADTTRSSWFIALRGPATSNWYIFDFFDIFRKCYFYILYTFLSICVNFQGNLIFFSWKNR